MTQLGNALLVSAIASLTLSPGTLSSQTLAEPPALDSVVMTNRVCERICNGYRVSIRRDGTLAFTREGLWTGIPERLAKSSVEPGVLSILAREARRLDLFSFPTRIRESQRVCEVMRTHASEVTLELFGPGLWRRIEDYYGCLVGRPGASDSPPILAPLRAFHLMVDSIAGIPAVRR